jgi:hypothetical protein
MATIHDGKEFKIETNPLYGSWMVVCKSTGRWVYVRGANAIKLTDAVQAGWTKFGFNADGDDVWRWIWTNCGFYRLAS